MGDFTDSLNIEEVRPWLYVAEPQVLHDAHYDGE